MATDVRLLAQGTVIFEDISIEQFEGTVVKVIPKVPTKNQASRLQVWQVEFSQIGPSCFFLVRLASHEQTFNLILLF